MPRPSAAPSAPAHAPTGGGADDVVAATLAEVIDFDDVAWRRERLATYAARTRPVVVYRFVIPADARVAGLGPVAAPRDARDQLHLIVGMTGGGVTAAHDGLAARIPKVLAATFEAMARPLIEAYLVALDLGEAPSGPA